MQTEKSAAAPRLEFEPVKGAAELRLSRSFESPRGDRIRVVMTARNSAVITPTGARRSALDTLVIDGLDDSGNGAIARSFWGKVWDVATSVASDVLDAVTDDGGGSGGGGGGSNTRCSVTVHQTYGPDGRLTGQTWTTTCSPV